MPSVQLDRTYQVVLLSLDDDSSTSRLIKAYDTVFDFDTALALLDSGEKVFPRHWPYSPLTGGMHYMTKLDDRHDYYGYLGVYYPREDLREICSRFEFMLMSPNDLDIIVVTDDKEVTDNGC